MDETVILLTESIDKELTLVLSVSDFDELISEFFRLDLAE